MFENLRKIRKAKDIKVKEICELLNLETEAAYYKKETGKVPFTLDEGKKIASLLREPIETLFFENELSCEDNIESVV
jgi:transcriptional regulator with XRE-family HTH domain